MNLDITDTFMILGRILLGGLFVFGGIKHFFIVPMLTEVMSKRGVPFAKLTLIAGSLFQIVAGAALVTGFLVMPAALGLVAFTIVASIMLLNFWDMRGEQREAAFNNWAVNVGVIGGLLIAASHG